MLRGDFVEAEVREFAERNEVLDAVLVEAHSVGFAAFVEVTKGRKDSLANSFSVGVGSLSRMPTSPLASAAR
jgi:hypothetical protein